MTPSACHHRVSKAIKEGTLVRPKQCSACGKVGPVEGHHEDYDKPLEVIWLCSPCHRKLPRTWVERAVADIRAARASASA